MPFMRLSLFSPREHQDHDERAGMISAQGFSIVLPCAIGEVHHRNSFPNDALHHL